MVSLILRGRCNMPGLFINTLVCTLENGEDVVLDRDNTMFSRTADGELDITWTSVYIWDGEDKDYEASHIDKVLDNVSAFEVEVEDDAPAEYDIVIDYLECYVETTNLKVNECTGEIKAILEDYSIEVKESLENDLREYFDEIIPRRFKRITYRDYGNGKFVKFIDDKR